MTTTTLEDIIAKFVTVIEALTPTTVTTPSHTFKLSKAPNRPLRLWLPDAGDNLMLRRFDIGRDGSFTNLGVNHTVAALVTVPILMTIAYPAKPKLYGLAQLNDLRATIGKDALQIQNKLLASGTRSNVAHLANYVEIRRLDETQETRWFQDLAIDVTFVENRVPT